MSPDIRTERIKSSLRINEIRKTGRSFSSKLTVLVIVDNHLEMNRAAVIASRSVGGAVQRNRCKRILRSRIRQKESELRPGYDILLISREALLKAEPNEIDNVISQLFVEAGLI